jgi:hypothetical protein
MQKGQDRLRTWRVGCPLHAARAIAADDLGIDGHCAGRVIRLVVQREPGGLLVHVLQWQVDGGRRRREVPQHIDRIFEQ